MLQEHFQDILKQAKDKVEGPSGPKLKIVGPKPKVMLNLSQHRESPVPGTSIDHDALARQKQSVQAGVNGRQAQNQPTPPTNGLVRSASDARPGSSTNSGSPPAQAAIKGESRSTQSPAPHMAAPAVQPMTNGMMPPPTLRPSSGSPFPNAQTYNGYAHQPPPTVLAPTQLRNYPLADALLADVRIATHPHLKVPVPFSLSIPPHATLSHQSTTITLPSSHYFVQISPTISKQLSAGQPYKVFVTVNGTRLTQRDTVFDAAGTERRTHVYEGSLAQGVNRVEVEVAAAAMGREDGSARGLEVEKTTVFVNLMRG